MFKMFTKQSADFFRFLFLFTFYVFYCYQFLFSFFSYFLFLGFPLFNHLGNQTLISSLYYSIFSSLWSRDKKVLNSLIFLIVLSKQCVSFLIWRFLDPLLNLNDATFFLLPPFHISPQNTS